MLSVTDAQLNAWLAAFLWPLARVLGLLMVAPVLSTAPARVRIGLGVVATLAIAPMAGTMPEAAVGSLQGLLILAQEVAVGAAMGFAVRLTFAALQVAGDLAGLQMGLGFATFFDPQSSGQTPVMAQFVELAGVLLFLAINGHLMMMAALAQSFQVLPVGAALAPGSWRTLAELGTGVFSLGVLLALPVVGPLLVVNVVLGVLSRAAPQLNIFAVGFPMTLMAGFVALAVTLPYLAPVLDRAFTEAIGSMVLSVAPSR
ncbi:MAG: flagellar biosynthetic protein FliR [Azospira oryzae]|uniref:Flagellar biosynthetic protein FliR n=1 Tax=Pelomicrobium methylotrophicum TaxID=2602750 RepID=A0A5C7EHS9_9PROT|nr:flagellar biosynthetic protein FliR [Pelomicrobium methylotrophicum]PZP61802.1 MAG: flagellar biosynthetic protein FliR [Azospira oryzae]PZP81301.1 MAG: flagellar biosynthetic protein FliR [Azospira oryzae]TXF11816.1 flagellar biosynthetic protein FliR [Pelomicrobium methylotrophicum]